MFETKWDAPEAVEKFARRDPDLRLRALLADRLDPRSTRALDIGCAGGRNTVLLARCGVDVEALDASPAMVERTRRRLTEVYDPSEAERRVRLGRMDELEWADSGSFDLVVSLGVLHCAESPAEWQRAVVESARVLRPGGYSLVAVFTSETDFTGGRVRPVTGEANLYEGFSNGHRAVLVDAEGLDAAMKAHHLVPALPTDTVVHETEIGYRYTVNALYRKQR